MAANGNAPQYGEMVEEWACDALFLSYEDETHYDAENHNGRLVQIKGARHWVNNGYNRQGEQARCRGRFKFFEGDHERLKEDDGIYLLVVYEKDGGGGINVVEAAYYTPEKVGEIIDGDWYSEGDIREASKGLVYRTTWSSFLEVDA